MKTHWNLVVLGAALGAASLAQASQIHFDGKLLNQVLVLKNQQTHTIYRDEEVPDTCTRTEQDGYRQECHTEYDHSCTNITRRQCHQVNDRQCTPISRRECTPISRRECDPTTHACRDVPDTVCRDVPDQVCRDNSREVCEDVPDQVCQTTPRQACESVPNYVDVPYACTKTVSVPVGTALDYNVTAKIAVNFSGVPAQTKPDETLDLQISGDDVQLSLVKASDQVLMQVQKKVDVKVTGNQQKMITARFDVKVLTFQELCGGALSSLDLVSLNDAGVVSLNLNGDLKQNSLALHLKVTEKSFVKIGTILDADIDAKNMAFNPAGDSQTQLTVDLHAVDSSIPFAWGYYEISATAQCNKPANLINPATFDSQSKSATGSNGAWVNAH